jgi:hypothetical protein
MSDADFGDAQVTLNDCWVVDNTAFGGGGIGIASGSSLTGALTLNRTTVSGNSAEYWGGGIWVACLTGSVDPSSLLAVYDSTISGNTVSGMGFLMGVGGGIAVVDTNSTATLVNSTVSGNEAIGSGVGDISGLGGGIVVASATYPNAVSLLNTTVADNTSNVAGGGIFVGTLGGAAELISQNSVVGGNAAPAGGESCSTYDWGLGPGTFTSLGHNLEDHDTCQFHQPGDLVNTDPLLGPLGDYGGPAETHLLLTGSPAVDAGDDAAAPPADQRGIPRPQGPASDIGAYEAEAIYEGGIKLCAFDFGWGRYRVYGTVRILTQEGDRPYQASVDVEWTLPDGSTQSQQALTNPRGLARFRINSRQTGTHQLCVTGASKDGYTYDPDQNWQTCKTVQVP